MLVRSASWDKTADVVVLGYGGGGAVAAITAVENGVDALIIEKQARDKHYTNTNVAGGIYITPVDYQSGLEYITGLARVAGFPAMLWTDRGVNRAWAEYAATGAQWVKDRGGNIFPNPSAPEFPTLTHAKEISKHRFKGMGVGLARFLDDVVKAKKIPVLYETKATHLLTNLRGRVIGVEVIETAGGQTKKMRIGANKAVILATGGFEYDEEMKLQYLKVYPTYSTGPECNTGDGVRMALEVGAQLWHMNCVSARFVFKFPDFPIAFGCDYLGRAQLAKAPGAKEEDVPVTSGHIIVDRDGKRFTSENLKGHSLYYELPLFDTHRLMYTRVPSFFVFDSRRMANGAMVSVTSGAAGPLRLYQWSADNSKELDKGWIKTDNTIRGLARKLGIPADNLDRTVRGFNRYCLQGKDPEFNRHKRELIPLENPPYYAVQLWPGGPNTQGGPRRNAKGQIVNADGNPIPGLYGSGELGSVYGMLYPGAGGNLTECFAFGRVAGENAAKE